MTVRYEHLYHISFSDLDSAIDSWRSTESKLKEIASDYKRDVGPAYRTAEWSSSDGSSGVADKRNTHIAQQIDDAHGVARALKNNLTEAREGLLSLQKSLHHIAEVEAPDNGLKVGSTGVVSESGAGGSVDQKVVDAFAKRISGLLTEAAEVDSSAASVIARNIGADNTDFRSDPIKNTEKDDAVAEYKSPGLPGSGTVKPIAEFLSYRSWMNSANHLFHFEFSDAWDDFLGGAPAFVAGEVSSGMNDKYGGGPGKHRKLNPINRVGIAGTKVFGIPVGVAATVVDFFYTSPNPEEKERKTDTVAPSMPSNKKVN